MSGLIIVLIKLLNEFLADLEFDSHVCRYIDDFARVRVSSVSFWALVWFKSAQSADCYFATCFDFIFDDVDDTVDGLVCDRNGKVL